jgi:hypothetical protein
MSPPIIVHPSSHRHPAGVVNAGATLDPAHFVDRTWSLAGPASALNASWSASACAPTPGARGLAGVAVQVHGADAEPDHGDGRDGGPDEATAGRPNTATATVSTGGTHRMARTVRLASIAPSARQA